MPRTDRPAPDPGIRAVLVIVLLLSIISFALGAIGPFGPTMSFALLISGAVLAIAVAALTKVATSRRT
ncbi:MAG: hypothetical protein WA991_04905 [Ornithinimicrobium sp.]